MSAAGENDEIMSVSVEEAKAPLLGEQNIAQTAGRRILKVAGNFPLRLLSFVGSVGTAVILIFGLLGALSNVFTFVQDIYTIIFCLTLALVEMCWWSWAPRLLVLHLRLKLFKKFNFLTRAWGKGMLTIYIGSIMLAKWEFFDIISGIYMLAIGVLFIIYGRFAERKMKRLKGQAISFASVDRNNDGKIDMQELQATATAAGMPMSSCELYLAFALLDTNGDGVVSVEEFQDYFNYMKIDII